MNSKLNITWLTDTQGINLFRWNFLYNSEELLRLGHKCQWLPLNTPDLFEKLKDSQIVIYYRCTTRHTEMIQRMRKHGIRVGYITDDLLWVPNEVAYHPIEAEAIQRYFDHVDFLLFHTEFLSQQAVSPAARYIKPTALPSSFLGRFEVTPAKDGVFRICLTKGHLTRGLVSYVQEMLQQLDVHPDAHNFEMSYFSSNQRLFSAKNVKLRAVPEVHGDLNAFYSRVQSLKPDCVINPIPQTKFMNAKGFIKFFETVMFQIPLITTETFQNTKSMGGDDAALFVSSPDEMAFKIIELRAKPEIAEGMPQRAKQRCLADFTVEVVTKRFVADMQSMLATEPRPLVVEPRVKDLAYSAETIPSFFPTTVSFRPVAERQEPVAVSPQIMFQNHTQSLLYPITFGRFFEQRVPFSMECRSIQVKGHNYRARISQPIRCDIIRQSSIVQTGFIEAKHAQDGVWWPVTFSSSFMLQEGDVVRFTNQDKRPVSFYYSDYGSRKEAAAMRFVS